jgi:SAM-dependent methyltransferase
LSEAFVITGRVAIKQEYCRTDVAEAYVDGRFEDDSLGRALHREQVDVLHEIFAHVSPTRVLEIAPGPARISVEIPRAPFRCAIEQSPAMLEVAGRRLKQREATPPWRLVRGDGFQLPVADGQFDLAMTFRFVRHFPERERRQLFDEIRRVLRPGGRLVMDVPNHPMYAWWFAKMGIDHARVDDYWFVEDAFRKEMREAGFGIERLEPMVANLPLQHLISARLAQLPRLASLASGAVRRVARRWPLEWMACCQCA